MTNSSPPPHTERTRTALPAVAASAAAAVLIGGGAVLGIGALVEAGGDARAEAVTDRTADVGPQVSEQAYAGVPLQSTKEAVLAALRPAEPVDVRILDRYEDRSPETLASSCVYFESEGIRVGALYRFCFENDVLVDKTVVLPTDDP